jgi:hypothetical protein
MEIILSKLCEGLTGSLGKGFGYHIQRRTDLNGKTRFWGVRQSNGAIPADGHWLFIVLCATMAQKGLYIADIRVSAKELRRAINEAGRLWGDSLVEAPDNQIYNASDVLRFKWKWCI